MTQRAANSAARTGVKEYTAAVKGGGAAALEIAARQLKVAESGLGTWALDSHYGQQLSRSIGGTDAESSIIRC